MNYWLISAGFGARDYVSDFIRFGMAFVGGKDQISTMEQVDVGDIILLKRGMSEVVAVGEIVRRGKKHRGRGDKVWLRDFDGWDLEAYCFVDWHLLDRPNPIKGLTRGTIKKVVKDNPRKFADEVIATVPTHQLIDPEPKQTKPVKACLKVFSVKGFLGQI